MAQRKQSDSVKKMRLLILGLSLALILAVVAVTWFTLSREAQNGGIEWKVTSTTAPSGKIAGEPDETTTTAAADSGITTTTNADGLPYSKHGSDLYATWDGKYPSAEVVIKKDENGKYAGFVKDKKVNCTGIYCNEYGWWFVRDGYVDFNYSGVAGNEKGIWYVENGKCNFNHSGAFTAQDSGKSYTIVEGKVAEMAN